MNNLTGMNFYKTQNKPKLISNLANQYNENDLRSSSAIDQRVHSVGKRVGYEDKVNIAIPKILKNKINYVGLDIDKLRDELIKLKVDYNNKVKEFNSLRVDAFRLEEENKRNNKIIEEFINEASKYSPEINNIIKSNEDNINSNKNIEGNNFIENYNNSNPNKLNFNSINPANIIKLREVFMINNLKKQILNFKQILKEKDEELTNLKANSKVAKLQLLENEFRVKREENYTLKENLEDLKEAYQEKELKLKETFDEKEYYKNLMMKIKHQYEDSKEKLRYYQEENLKIMEQKKLLEDKNSNNKLASNSIKSAIKDKDSEITKLKEEYKSLEDYKLEKPKLEKKLSDLQKQVSSLKEDQERKTLRIKDLEKLVMTNRVKHDEELESKTNAFTKKIRSLEQEISNLKKHEKEVVHSNQPPSFITQQPLNPEQAKKIEELEKKISAQTESHENDAKTWKELESKFVKLEAEYAQIKEKNQSLEEEKNHLLKQLNQQSRSDDSVNTEIKNQMEMFTSKYTELENGKASLEQENSNLIKEKEIMNKLINELNDKLEKYINLEKSLINAVAQKDENETLEFKGKLSSNGDNPYKKKKKNNEENQVSKKDQNEKLNVEETENKGLTSEKINENSDRGNNTENLKKNAEGEKIEKPQIEVIMDNNQIFPKNVAGSDSENRTQNINDKEIINNPNLNKDMSKNKPGLTKGSTLKLDYQMEEKESQGASKEKDKSSKQSDNNLINKSNDMVENKEGNSNLKNYLLNDDKIKRKDKNKDDFTAFDQYFEKVHKSKTKINNSEKNMSVSNYQEPDNLINELKSNNANTESNQIRQETDDKKIPKETNNNYSNKKDDEYNFDEAIAGNLQDNFRDNENKNVVADEENKGKKEVEYEYDDFIVENSDNLFPKKKNK